MTSNQKTVESRQGVSVPISLPFFNKLMKNQHALIATQIAKINKLTEILNAKTTEQQKKHQDNMHYYEGIQKYLQKELKKKKELLEKLTVVGGSTQHINQESEKINEKVDSIHYGNNQNKEQAPPSNSQEQEESSSEQSQNNQNEQEKQIVNNHQINEQMNQEQIDYYQI